MCGGSITILSDSSLSSVSELSLRSAKGLLKLASWQDGLGRLLDLAGNDLPDSEELDRFLRSLGGDASRNSGELDRFLDIAGDLLNAFRLQSPSARQLCT